MSIARTTGPATASLTRGSEGTFAESARIAGADARERTSLAEHSNALFTEHAAFVYRTAYGVTGRHEDAEDVLQTVFLRLLRRDLPLELTKNPRAYLYRAAVNASLDTIRSRRRHVLVENGELPELPAPDRDSQDKDTQGDERHQLLYRAIAELKPQAREMLILRYVHDKSDAEIARMLGVSRGTVALRLFRSRARLRRLLRVGMKGSS